MFKKIKEDVLIKLYAKAILIAVAIYVVMLISVYAIDKTAGTITLTFFVIYVAGVVYAFYKRAPGFNNEIVRYAANYDKIQNRLLKDLAIPYALVDLEGATIWANESFKNVVGNEKAITKSIFNVLCNLSFN